MEKVIVAVVTTLLCSILSTEAQEREITWGVKGGGNYSTLWDRVEMEGRPEITYSYKTGFYVGALAGISLSEKFLFQPEILFSHRNTGIEINNINMMPIVASTSYRAIRTESVIDLPLIFRYRAAKSFFVDAGPQMGYLLDQKEEVKESPYGEGNQDWDDYDRFDAGLSAGLGFNLNQRFSINARYFQGLIKRDNSVQTSVLNLGVEFYF